MKHFAVGLLAVLLVVWSTGPALAWNPSPNPPGKAPEGPGKAPDAPKAPEHPKDPGKTPEAPKEPKVPTPDHPQNPGTPPTSPEPPRTPPTAPSPGTPGISQTVDPNAWYRFGGWSWNVEYAGYIVVWGIATSQQCMKARDEYNKKHRGHVCVPVHG